MQRRAFVRRTLAGSLAAPAALGLRASPLWAAPPRQSGPARLASNENPLGVPDTARTAIIEAITEGNRYPRLQTTVAARLAQRNNVAPANIVLGNGSAEILQMTVQAAAAGTRNVRVVIADPTFEQVERYALAMFAEVVKVPLLPDHSHDLDAMRAAALAAPGPALVFICNPNNPTGTLTSCDDVAAMLRTVRADVWFLIDEAYLDYVEAPGYRALVTEALSRPNTLVSRTFSKIYGLAGIRLGYGIAERATAERVADYAAATNINHLAAAAALACLDDTDFVRRSLDVNRQGRDFAYATLRELGIEHFATHANFVMHRVRGELRDYIAAMRDAGVNVGRAFPPLLQHNRVSFGLPWEMDAWASALHQARTAGLV